MKFLVLGGGMQGRACAFDLVKNPAVDSVVLADASLENLASAEKFIKSRKIKTRRMEAADVGAVKKLARGCQAMVSAVPYFFNLPLAKAAIAAKTHFVDLGGNTEIVLKELSLHDQAKKAGITIIPDVGLGPGMTTTIAAHGIGQLDEAEEVYIRDGGLPQNPLPPMNYRLTFSEYGLINEYAEKATALRNGRRVEVPGLSEIETLDLPPPLGRCEAAHAAGGLSTMAWTYEGRIRTMDCKLIRYPGHCAVMRSLNAMGFFDRKKRHMGGRDIVPRDLSALLFREHFGRGNDRDLVVIHIVVRGRKEGKRVELVYDMLDKYDERSRMTAMMRTTGFPASIVAQMLASGALRKPGAYPVERAIPTAPFLAEAKKRGFNLSWELRHLP